MKKLSIIVLLVFIPSTVFPKIGDVYFCEMESLVGTDKSEVTKYKLEQFKFKQTEKGLIFGSEEGFFSDFKLTRVLINDGDS